MAITDAEKILMRLLFGALTDLTLRCDKGSVLADGASVHTHRAHAAIDAVDQYERDTQAPGPSYYMPARERYMNDPMFKMIVDLLANELRELRYTPTELREAVIMAATIVDSMALRSIFVPGDNWPPRGEKL